MLRYMLEKSFEATDKSDSQLYCLIAHAIAFFEKK